MLQFEGLCAGYDGEEWLHGVSCSVEAGKLTALIGPNGCGKSTLMKCAAGLLAPSAGEIYLNSQPYSAFSRRALACQAAYMPQSRLAPDIPVRRLVSHGRYPHLKWGHSLTAHDRSIVSDAMERADVARYADRSVARLSGGERQRVYLAMMLAQQTPVLLLDEPTTYLDLGAQFALMDLLRALAREGRAVLIVLHDLALAFEYADTLLLLSSGRLLSSSSPSVLAATSQIPSVFHVHPEQVRPGKYIFTGEENGGRRLF